MTTLDCGKADPLQSSDDPTHPLVTCSTDGKEVFVLAPSIIDGRDIASATSHHGTMTAQFDNVE